MMASPIIHSADRIIDYNNKVRQGTLEVDPRIVTDHPLSDIVCGWCGEIHSSIKRKEDVQT